MRLRYRTVLYQVEDGTSIQDQYHEFVSDIARQIQSVRAVSRRLPAWRPASDIHETPDAYIVKMELAGMAEEDIEVTLYANAVVVSGTRRDEDIIALETNFHEAEIRYGPFQATVRLANPIERETAEARYYNGFLRLVLPKKPPERLPVKSGKVVELRDANQALPASETTPQNDGGGLHE